MPVMAMASMKFTDNSKKAKQAIADGMDAGLEAALLIVEAQAKALTPVDSGGLRDSLTHAQEKTSGGWSGIVGTPLMYGIYVEFGTGEFASNGAGRKGGWRYMAPDGKWYFTKGMQAQPFLLPAFRRTKKNVETTLGAKLKEVTGKL